MSIILPIKGEIPSFQRAYRKSYVIWGLWHSGGRTRRNELHIKYHSLKRILLLDPYTPAFEACFENYYDFPEQARKDILALTKEAIEHGIEVRWYSEMRSCAFTIFNPGLEDAWVLIEEHKLLVSRDDRPKKLLYSKHNQEEYDSILNKFNSLWGIARIPLPGEYNKEQS